ncbi:MAG TPA: hypothetical protein VD993_01725 [Chitinophagaceae bacterium]|nr:hypothetical protein [Chitinophagaceae bacterium]
MSSNTRNERGELNLKRLIKRITYFSLILLLLVGGGCEGSGWSLKTEGLPGIIRAVADLFEKKKGQMLPEYATDAGLGCRALNVQIEG